MSPVTRVLTEISLLDERGCDLLDPCPFSSRVTVAAFRTDSRG